MKAFLTFALLVVAVSATCDNDCEECGPDQLACPGPDPTLCPTCIAIHDGTLDNWGNPCHASCPAICGENEQVCGAGPDPWSGCQMPGYCEPTMDPVTECPMHCHVMCGPDEVHCPMGMDAAGCPMPDMCFGPDGLVDNWGNPCHASCPTVCGENEHICGAGPDPWSGCQMSGWCEPSMDPVTECPIHCPAFCGPDDISCPGTMDAAGCRMPDTCMPGKTAIIDNWGNPCWNSCPVVCDEGHQVCGAGTDPWSGCPVSGWCEPLMDWNDCPKHCPAQCGPEEVHCWGGWDGTCNLPDYCSPIAEGCPPQ